MITGIPLVGWPDADHAESTWLAARQAGLGASEVASALGLPGAYETPWQVWARKTGRLSAEKQPNDAMQLGTDLEPWLIDRAEHELNAQSSDSDAYWVVRRSPARLYRAKAYPFLLASPDAIAIAPGRDLWSLVECKTAGLYEPWLAEEWAAGVPFRFQVQALCQMIVTGIHTQVHVVALGAGFGVRFETVTWDAQAAADVVTAAGRWWNAHVELDREPELSPRDDAVIAGLYDEDAESSPAELDPALVVEYQRARRVHSEAVDRFAVAKARMRKALGVASEGAVNGRRMATWKTNRAGNRSLWVSSKMIGG